MIKQKILVVDDDENILSLLTDVLERENFVVITAPDTDEGYKKALKSQPDLIILDVKMPKIGGIELCRLLREDTRTKNVPIIMLTVESSETDKVIGFEVGADDYITKPFSTRELIARIKSLLRRVSRSEVKSDIIKVENLEVDMVSRTVNVGKKVVYLRPKEFELLVLFIKKPNIVLNREYILESIFGYKTILHSRTIDTHIKNLRKALGPVGKKIKTVFGYGFKFVP